MDNAARRQALEKTAFCKGLSDTVMDELAEVAELRSFEAEQAVVKIGDEGDGLYVVVDGSARVENAFAGDTKVVGTLKAGEIFGEVALLGGGKRSSTVVAAEALSCLVLPTAKMHAEMERHPEVREHLENLGHRRSTTNLELHLGDLPEVED